MKALPTNNVVCPGCGLTLPQASSPNGLTSDPYNASQECFSRYAEVLAYTWQSGDAFFVHQAVLDTYTASHIGEQMKPIQPFFALAGLCLANEKGYTGRQVQQAHMAMGKCSKNAPAPPWPVFMPPAQKTAVTVAEVLAAPPGQERDAHIANWSRAVWETWANEHDRIRTLTQAALETAK